MNLVGWALLTNSDPDGGRCPPYKGDRMAIATLALGLFMFALFFGLVVACDRL